LKLLSSFSSIMASFAGRPHWAKQHNLVSADFRELYPKFPNFVKLTNELGGDVPGGGMWGSEYTRRHLGDAPPPTAERGLVGDDGGKVDERV
jgi:L-gulonolactone oxidase